MNGKKIPNLTTKLPNLALIAPDPDRDAPYAVQWFTGDEGIHTLRLMGNSDDEILPTSLKKETATLQNFVEKSEQGKQVTWMIRYDEKTIGAIWVTLEDTDFLQSPAVHLMIGDSSERAKGIGSTCLDTVLRYLYCSTAYPTIYTRHLVSNEPVTVLLTKVGFKRAGKPYVDTNGLMFANMTRAND